jgi:hypothetical protein
MSVSMFCQGGDLCEDNIRDKIKTYSCLIQSLKPDKIKFEDWRSDEVHIISVDGTNFRTEEFHLEPSSKWYDHKTHSCGLKYEFSLALWRNSLMWIRGPFPTGKLHDLTVFRGGTLQQGEQNWNREALYFHLPPGTKAIGDSGYQGIPKKVTTSSDAHSKEMPSFLAHAEN